MTRKTPAFLALCLAAQACRPPEECLRYAGKSGPLSYEKVVVEGHGPFPSWQEQLRGKVRTELGLTNLLEHPTPLSYRTGDTSTIGDPSWPLLKTEVRIESLVDRTPLRAFLLRSEGVPESAPQRVVLLLHGHRSAPEDALDRGSMLRGTALALARSGFAVLVPEVRSFGRLRLGDLGHKLYVQRKAQGEFLREALGDAYSCVRFLQDHFPNRKGLIVIGHSLGGTIALHLAAAVPAIDHAVASGSFVPYSCLDTEYHHQCQWVKGLAAEAEVSDVAGLVFPRRLLVHFGEKDRFYTPAVSEVVAKARRIYSDNGAADAFRFEASKGLEHELDPDAVLRFLRD